MQIAQLTIEMAANVARLKQDMDRARGMVENAMGSIGRTVEQAKKILAGLAVAGTTIASFAALSLQIRNITSQASELQRFSQVANTSLDQFQRWGVGAQTVGIQQEKLADILKDVNDRVGDFNATGGGPMADFFEKIAPRINLTADAFRGLSGADALQLYVTSLEKAGVNQQDMTFYMEAMASDATALLPLLTQGGQGMQYWGDAAAQAGALIDEKAVLAGNRLASALTALETTGTGLRNQFVSALLPTLTDIAGELLSVNTEASLASTAGDVFAAVLKGIAAAAVAAYSVIVMVGKAIGGVAAAANQLMGLDLEFVSTLDWVKSPRAALETELQNFEKIKNAFGSASNVMKDVFSDMDDFAAKQDAVIRNLLSAGSDAFQTGDSAARLRELLDAQQKYRDGLAAGLGVQQQDEEAKKKAAAAAEQLAKRYADLVNGVQGKLLDQLVQQQVAAQGLNSAEAELLKLRLSPEWALFEPQQRTLLETDYKLLAVRERAIETEAAYKAVQESATKAAADDLATIRKQVKEQAEANAKIGLGTKALAALEIAKIRDAAATKRRLAEQMYEADGDSRAAASYRAAADELERLAQLKAQGIVQQASADAQTAFRSGWAKTGETIRQTLQDYIMEGGQNGAEYLERLFRNLLIQPTVSAIFTDMGGSLSSAITGSGGLTGGLGLSAGGLVNAGQTLWSAFGGGLVSTVGGAIGSLGSLFGSSAITSFAAGMKGASLAAGLAGPTTAGAAGAMGAGAAVASVLPWAAAALAITNLLGVFKESTPHIGARTSWSTETGAGQGLKSDNNWGNLGVGRMDDSPEVAQITTQLARTVAENLAGFLSDFGKQSIVEVFTLWADDASKDSGWGSLRILVDDNEIVNQHRRDYGDGEEGYQAYVADIGQTYLAALKQLDIPRWASDVLDGVAAGASLETIAQTLAQLAAMRQTIEGWSQAITGFAGYADEAMSRLITASGGFESLSTNISTYYQQYYSDAERADHLTRQMTDALAAYNVALPASTADFRKLVEQTLDSGESGADLAAVLLGISGTFKQVMDVAGATGETVEVVIEQIATAFDGLAADGIKGILDTVLAQASSAAEAQQLAQAQAGQYLYEQLVGSMTAGVAEMIMTSVVAPLTSAAANAATIDTNAAAIAASSLAAGGGTAAGNLAAGGAIAADSLAGGGAEGAARIDAAIAQVRDYISNLGTVLADEGVRAALGDLVGVIGSAAGIMYDTLPAIQTFTGYTPTVAAATATSTATSASTTTVVDQSAALQLLAQLVDDIATDGMTDLQLALHQVDQQVAEHISTLQSAGLATQVNKALLGEWADVMRNRANAEAQQAIDTERLGLDRQYWQLIGNSAAVRADELAALDPSNQALQRHIMLLEDATTIYDLAATHLGDTSGLESQLAHYRAMAEQQTGTERLAALQQIISLEQAIHSAQQTGTAQEQAALDARRTALQAEITLAQTLADTVQSAASLQLSHLGDPGLMRDYTTELWRQFGAATDDAARTGLLQEIVSAEQAIAQARQTAQAAEAQALQARLTALDAELRAAQDLASAAQTLADYVQQLRTGELSGLSESDRRAALSAQYEDLSRAARTGDADALRDLQSVSTELLQLEQLLSVSGADYSVTAGRIGAEMDAIARANASAAAGRETRVSAEQAVLGQQIDALDQVAGLSQQTLDAIAQLYTGQTLAWQAEADLLQQQLDALEPDQAQFEISTATRDLLASLLEQSTNSWTLQDARSVDLTDSIQTLQTLTQYAPTDINAHISSSVVPALQEMCAQLRSVEQRLAGIKTAADTIARSTTQTAEHIDSVSAGGNAIAVEIMIDRTATA